MEDRTGKTERQEKERRKDKKENERVKTQS